MLLLTFTPTKWAVQFGAFAGFAAALGAVTAFTLASVGLHSRRNLSLYITALLFVLAWATSGINGWFYVGNYGVPWRDIQPVIASHPVTSMFLTASIATGLLAAWQHFRLDYAGHTEVKPTRRNRILASTPLLVVATIMVLVEVGSMAKAAAARYPVYTTAKANIDALRSGLSDTSCAMADDVLAEPDPNAGLLQPVPGQAYGPDGPLGGVKPVGFKPNGVADDLTSDPVVSKPAGQLRRLPQQAQRGGQRFGGHRRRLRPVGVNGSRAALPFGLDPARTPVMGSYGENTVAAHATSVWYQLPPRTPDRPLVVVAAAARSGRTKRTGHSATASRCGCSGASAVPTAPPRRSANSSRSTSGRKSLGATCDSRWPGRRRRLTWHASLPTIRISAQTSGSPSRRRGCRCCKPCNN
ncbi:mycobacterial cell wall arabinan synthesis family protein [Mycobacterium xenopi 3993]|nr:mycobacterial cell wall arabinan synthesis family protein [Mycobacterium xenopi 3993]